MAQNQDDKNQGQQTQQGSKRDESGDTESNSNQMSGARNQGSQAQ